MQKLLSVMLSLCLLVSTVSPSLAQVVPFKAVAKGVSSSALKTSLQKIVQQEAVSSLRGLTFTNLSFPQAQALSSSILQGNALTQLNKIHNDWVGLVVNFQEIATMQAPKVTALLTEDLTQKQIIFSQIPHQKLSAFLEGAQGDLTPAVMQVREALADASVIALVGTKQDAQALRAFYESARGSVFEPVAGVIVSRGLLRYGAYEELNAFLQSAGNMGKFGESLARYVEEKQLPVQVPAQVSGAQIMPANLQGFLQQAGMVHGLHADPSYEATCAWVNLGKEQAQPLAQADLSLPRPAKVAVEKIKVDTDFKLPSQVTLAPQTLQLAGAPVKPASQTSSALAQKPIQAGKAVEAAKKTTTASADNSGILYSGIPVFAIEKYFKNLISKVRTKRQARAVKKNALEEADLHENNVRAVLQETEPVVNEEEDIFSATEDAVSIEKDGYKLTLEDENLMEHTLRNVTLSVSPALVQFSPEYNRLTLTEEHIFELRNQVIAPIRPDHFFFALNPENGALETLIKGAKTLGMARSLRVKIQQTSSPRKEALLKLYADDSLTDFVIADVDKTLLPITAEKELAGAYLVVKDDKIFYVSAKTKEPIALDKYFIRLPKGESKYWTKIFANNPKTNFALSLYSTQEKTFAWTYLVPTMQIGLGKTMAPELASRTTLGEATSSIIMMSIINVLPVLMGFVHKSLKRYGEAAVGRIGVGSFVAGSVVALASGLYGMLGDGLMGPWQTAGFVTSSILLAIGTNITRFVQNILITANRGKIVAQDSFKNAPQKAGAAEAAPINYNGAYLAKRAKEVFAKTPKGAARDVVLFQTASMFKNLGTMMFLSFPWLANGLVKLTTGVDLNLDFSASYVPYSLFSAWTLYKVCKTAYKDAFPNKLNLLDNNLQETKQQAFKEILKLKPQELTADNAVIINAAKQLKGAIEAIGPVEARETGKKTSEVISTYNNGIPVELLLQAGLQGKTRDFGEKAMTALQESLENLGHRDVKVLDVLKMKGIPASVSAMALATFHELAVSNGFAFGMHAVVGRGATANALTALALYGSMSAGRILGNMLSRRVSGGTMYAVSSAMSVTGTALMAAANGNIGALIGGAVIASFGVGNFFSQMYEYMTGLYPKYRREIALLINYTMPAAAVMTFPMRWLVGYTGISNLDLLISGAGLIASLALTPGMFANSSLVKAGQQSWNNVKKSVLNIIGRHKPAPKTPNIEDALPN